MIELLLQAERLLSVGLLDKAEQLYRQVANADPKNSIAVVGLARVTLDRGDDEGALELARRAVAIDPENAAAQRLVARLEEVLEYRQSAESLLFDRAEAVSALQAEVAAEVAAEVGAVPGGDAPVQTSGDAAAVEPGDAEGATGAGDAAESAGADRDRAGRCGGGAQRHPGSGHLDTTHGGRSDRRCARSLAGRPDAAPPHPGRSARDHRTLAGEPVPHPAERRPGRPAVGRRQGARARTGATTTAVEPQVPYIPPSTSATAGDGAARPGSSPISSACSADADPRRRGPHDAAGPALTGRQPVWFGHDTHPRHRRRRLCRVRLGRRPDRGRR